MKESRDGQRHGERYGYLFGISSTGPTLCLAAIIRRLHLYDSKPFSPAQAPFLTTVCNSLESLRLGKWLSAHRFPHLAAVLRERRRQTHHSIGTPRLLHKTTIDIIDFDSEALFEPSLMLRRHTAHSWCGRSALQCPSLLHLQTLRGVCRCLHVCSAIQSHGENNFPVAHLRPWTNPGYPSLAICKHSAASI